MSKETKFPTRRDTLKAGLSLPLAMTWSKTVKAGSSDPIVVIGAGLSGLSAARDLARAGKRVVVLEARERIGGRIWTSRQWPTLPVDLGASWIHGVKGNPLTALSEEAGAKRLATRYESSTAYDAKGQIIDTEEVTKGPHAIIARARKAAARLDQDISLAQAITSTEPWATADAAQRRAIRHAVNAAVEQEYGGDWSEISAWHYDDSQEFSGGDELFPGGFDAIPSHLATGLDIRTGHEVLSITPIAGGVRIVTTGGAEMNASHAIVTLPLGVLKAGTVKFGAGLAPRRQRAIETMRMGLLNKCWMRFDQVRWPPDVDWIEWIGPQDGYWSQWVSLAQRTKQPVLLAFHAGSQARQMEQNDDKAMAALAHEALKAMLGTSFPAPAAVQITRWSRDPFSRGSYSFNAVGVTRQTRQALAGSDWDGRLFFAGEAASADYFGTAHGAVMSGRVAAKAVLGG